MLEYRFRVQYHTLYSKWIVGFTNNTASLFFKQFELRIFACRDSIVFSNLLAQV